jgi:D-3-phosphoglycerate dehydrogenase
MKKRVLVTDSLFIADSHVQLLRDAGFEVDRLDKPAASEEELIAAVPGVHGYILGGVERVTEPVISAARSLEAICFTGSGYTEFIPAFEAATKRGIAIATATGANAIDVAEFTIGLVFEMVRNFPLLRSKNTAKNNKFYTARRIGGLTIGIVGFGPVGSRVAALAKSLGMKVLVHSRSASPRETTGVTVVALDELLKTSDIVSVHVNKLHGEHALSSTHIALLKRGCILINTAFPEAVDCEATLRRVKAGEIRAAFDAAPPVDFSDCPIGDFTVSNAQTAFNTVEAIQDTSDRSTRSMINLLTRGEDSNVVNDFQRYRKNT